MHLTMEDLQNHHQNLIMQKTHIVGALQCVEQQMSQLKRKEFEAAKKKAEAEHDKRVDDEKVKKEDKK